MDEYELLGYTESIAQYLSAVFLHIVFASVCGLVHLLVRVSSHPLKFIYCFAKLI